MATNNKPVLVSVDRATIAAAQRLALENKLAGGKPDSMTGVFREALDGYRPLKKYIASGEK